MKQTGRPHRAGFVSRALIVLVAALLVASPIAWRYLPRLSNSASANLPMLHVVERGDFVHDITEKGTVESASNVEVRCEVQSQNMAGTRILEIVPEGTYVWGRLAEKKEEGHRVYYNIYDEDGLLCQFDGTTAELIPDEMKDFILGEVICRLDSSALENDLLKQKSVVENASAAMIQAESDYETAKKALEEYLEGKFKIDEALIEADRAVAQENKRRAEDTVRYSRRLLERGYITDLQLGADEFAATKAQTDLEIADRKLMVLREYTKKKTEVQLQADIKSFEAKLKAARNTYELEVAKLELTEKQIHNCTVRAPADGQVVYASVTDRMGGQEILIEEGAQVRERQVIVRLPDPKHMQVKAKINESKIALVRKGQRAVIKLDALPDQEFEGVVEKVNEYPAQGGWLSSTIKEYETTILILGSPEGLRPGLTAAATIRVAEFPNVVQVPVQAVFEHNNRFFAVVRKGDTWEPRLVETGHTNDKSVVIRSGLEPGEQVALNAAALRDQVSLPEFPQLPQPKLLLAGEQEAAGAEGSGEAQAGSLPPAPKPEQVASAPALPQERLPDGQGPRKSRRPGGSNPAGAGKGDLAAMANELFRKLDRDGNGKIERAELDDLPEQARNGILTNDTNQDGAIDRAEWVAAARRFAPRTRAPEPNTGGG